MQSLSQNTKTLTTTTKKTRKPVQEEFKYTNSRNLDLFPHMNSFPWRLEDRKENKLCWFTCEDHIIKYVTRYKLTKLQYKAQVYTG